MSKEVSHWFWNWGYLALGILVVVGFSLNKMSGTDNQDHVNPAVFAYFKQVEKECRAESFEKQSKKCAKMFDYQDDCKHLISSCNSLSFYQFLKKHGYQPPEYYQAGFVPH